MFPNGTVITPDERTLIVGESFGARLTAFDIARDGSLSNRRVFAALEGGAIPDGIASTPRARCGSHRRPPASACACTRAGACRRAVHGSSLAYACALGGPDRKTLFICTASTHHPAECVEKRGGKIETVNVDVPGAGWP